MADTRSRGFGRTAWILVIAAAGGGYWLIAGSQEQATVGSAASPTTGTAEVMGAEAGPADAGELRTVQIPVEGMTCAVCASGVRQAMMGTEGVVKAEVDLAQRHAVVRYVEGQVTPGQLAQRINGLGYRAGTPEAK